LALGFQDKTVITRSYQKAVSKLYQTSDLLYWQKSKNYYRTDHSELLLSIHTNFKKEICMKKIIVFGTILLIVALLTGGLYFPDYPLMWMASTSTQSEVIRLGLIAILTVLLFSNPPRAAYFRLLLAIGAVILGIITIFMVFNYQMNLIDALVFIEVAVILSVEALETNDSYSSFTTMKRNNATN
jgi:hypothetical protein